MSIFRKSGRDYSIDITRAEKSFPEDPYTEYKPTLTPKVI